MADGKTQKCVKKLGQSDEAKGMKRCGKPVEYLTAEQAISSGRGQYSGYHHTDENVDGNHWPVPASWVS